MESFQYLHSKVTFTEFIAEEINRKLIKLIIKNRYEIHYQLLQIYLFLRLLYSQVSTLRVNKNIYQLFPLCQRLFAFTYYEVNICILKLSQQMLLLVFPIFHKDTLEYGCFIEINFSYFGWICCQKSRNFRIVDRVREYFKFTRIFCLFLLLLFDQGILLILLFLVILSIVQSQTSYIDFLLLQLGRIFLFKLLNLINWVKFVEDHLCNVFGCQCPKLQILLRIWSKIAIKMEILDPLSISLGFLSTYLQKLRNFVIPPIDMYLQLFSKYEKFAYFKHMILRFQTICNDMSAQRNHLDAFKFSSNSPTDIIYSEFESFRRVKQQQYSQLLEYFIDIFIDHYIIKSIIK